MLCCVSGSAWQLGLPLPPAFASSLLRALQADSADGCPGTEHDLITALLMALDVGGAAAGSRSDAAGACAAPEDIRWVALVSVMQARG